MQGIGRVGPVRLREPWALPTPAPPAVTDEAPVDSLAPLEPMPESGGSRPWSARLVAAGMLGLSAATALAGGMAPWAAPVAAQTLLVPASRARPTDAALRALAPAPRPDVSVSLVYSDAVPALPPATIAQTRAALDGLRFPAVDPFIASVAASIWSGQNASAPGPTVQVPVPGHLAKPLPVELNLSSGPSARMLVILPGLGGDSTSSHVGALRKLALDHGMNYVVVPNPWSMQWQSQGPAHEPGILPEEAAATYDVLAALRAQHPAAFQNVSMVGYSYGAILGADVLDYQVGRPPLVNGGFAAISPPENLVDSMGRLDHLRHEYTDALDWMDVGSQYGQDISKYGYDRFMDSSVAKRTNTDVEKFLADTIASRNGLRDVVAAVDVRSGQNLLPLDHEVAWHGPVTDENRRQDLSDEQDWALDDATYTSYMDTWLARDAWFAQRHTTPRALADANRYTDLLDRVSGHGVPVLTLSAADDYILTANDAAALRAAEARPNPDQATHVLEHGGHVGMLFSPQVRRQVLDFVEHPPTASAPAK